MPKTNVLPVTHLAEELHLVIAQLVRRLRTESAQYELSWSQLSALARLETGGPATIASLARIEAVKPQSMGAIVATLERTGLVKREPHPSDRRQIVFSLTRAGQKVRVDGIRAKRKWLTEKITDELNSAEQRELGDAIVLLQRLLRMNSE